MRQSEIKELSIEELKERLAELKKQHADLKMTVARLATEITKRELQ